MKLSSMTAIRPWMDRGVQWLWPSPCLVCRAMTTTRQNPYLCRTCWGALPFLKRPWCQRCGVPFALDPALPGCETHWCGSCREREPHFHRARAAVRYEGVAAIAIRAYKYRGRQALVRPLAALIAPLLDELGPIDGVVAVPLHRRRLFEREYNQALLLARSTGWPLFWDLLERVRPTQPQVGLPVRERRRNVRGAFRVRSAAGIEGRTLLLVDDVMTTGSTVDECAGALKRSGAAVVEVLAVARHGGR
jgi:ComF family protein